MSVSPRLVIFCRGVIASCVGAGWTGGDGFRSLGYFLPAHHGTFCGGPYGFVGQSFRLSVPYGLDISADIFDDLVRPCLLVVAKGQNPHHRAMVPVFHRLLRLDLATNHTGRLISAAFARNEERI